MISATRRYWIEVVIHIAFWIGVLYTLNSLTGSTIKIHVNQNGTVMESSEPSNISPYSFVTLGFLLLLFYTNILWIFKTALRYKTSLSRFAAAAGWFILIFLVNYFIVGLFLNDSPLSIQSSQKQSVSSTQHGGGTLHVDTTRLIVNQWLNMQMTVMLIFMAVLGISIAYFFLKEWAKNEFTRSQLEANQLSTEIKFLKSQVNPHFLFNTLNNLFSMAQSKGNDELADGISKLSGMMRYMIYESNEENVPLKREIEYLQNCILLNKLRFDDDEVNVIFDYPDKTEGRVVAPMLFIPFVENAFKHGVSIGTSSKIKINISLAGKKLHFSCQNTSYSLIKKMENEKSGIGLENVKRRLDLVYPGKHRLIIDKEDEEFYVKLEIDLS